MLWGTMILGLVGSRTLTSNLTLSVCVVYDDSGLDVRLITGPNFGCIRFMKRGGRVMPRYATNLTGQVFGKLQVLERGPENDVQGNAVWLCRCLLCGVERLYSAPKLKKRLVSGTGCGECSQAPDLIGKRFGHLVVVERSGTDLSRNSVWLCKCDCGGERRVPRPQLMYGTTSYCKTCKGRVK